MFHFSRYKESGSYEKQKGLVVSVEELVAQQKYLPYISFGNNRLTSNQAGEVKSAFKGRGIELEEVREYSFGDDIRDIDWHVTARKAQPYTKIYNEEKDREIVVFLDLSPSMIFGTKNELKSVSAAKIAALIGWMAIRNKDRFGLVLFDGENTTFYKPQNNLGNLMLIFRKISEATQKVLTENRDKSMAESLKLLDIYQKGQGSLFIISDFYQFDSTQFKKIAALAKKHQIYCLHVFDILEEIAPQQGTYAAQYENLKTVFNTSTDDFRREYYKYFQEIRNDIKDNCRKFSCKYLEIRTDTPIFKQLRSL